MGKCTIIGKISIPASLGQAVRINGKKCNEQTVWNVSAYGGESKVTDFTLENRANVEFDIEFEFSGATDGEYTIGVYEDDGITPVSTPETVSGQATKNWKLKVDFDKRITEDDYQIYIEFDFTD